MQEIAKILSEMFMMVLSILAAPEDLKEFRLDLIQHSGRVETIVVRRTDAGFNLHQEREGKLVESGTLRPLTGKKDAYVLKLGDAPEQAFELGASLKDFTLEGLRKATKLDLQASDGGVVHVARSGGAVYLTPEKGRSTYACH
jgi:hypothetical protein